MNYFATINSPIGELLLGSDGDALCFLYTKPLAFRKLQAIEGKEDPQLEVFQTTSKQLQEYFDGERSSFEVPLNMQGSEFQIAVWQELCKIPYGTCRSYGDIARQLGNSKASRAVGTANGRNPISIIVPCHRVIGQNGSLTGYAGGLERKKFLLDLEAKIEVLKRLKVS